MEKENPTADYAAMLADMKAKRAALDIAITGLEAALAAGTLGVVVSDTLSVKDSVSVAVSSVLPRGALLGKPATEAIKLYLASVRKKQTNREISEALKQGGVESTSKNFDSFVNAALFRLKENGDVLRFDDGWGLAEWYPESFRTRIVEKAGNGGKRKAKAKAKAKKKTVSKPKTTPAAKSNSAPKIQTVGLDQQIMEVFAEDGEVVLNAEMIAGGLDVNRKVVSLALGRLAAKGKLEKTENGYKLARGDKQKAPKAKAS